jgi:hypothetical protein
LFKAVKSSLDWICDVVAMTLLGIGLPFPDKNLLHLNAYYDAASFIGIRIPVGEFSVNKNQLAINMNRASL